MTTCPKCSKELSEGTQFCDSCGAKIASLFCPHCGQQTSAESAFCYNCGASLSEKPAEEQPAAPQKHPAARKKLLKKAIMFGGIGAVVAAALIFGIALFLSGGKAKNNYAIYLKDSEIFFSDLKKDSKAWQLTSRLIDVEGVDNEELMDSADGLGSLICTSENGKYIFFPDRVGDSINLYYREIAKPEANAIKIDSDVACYTVNTSSTIVTYLKYLDSPYGDLYQFNLAENTKDKVASGVEWFEVSDDGTKIAYINSEGGLYLKFADKDREKVASEVDSVEYATDDFKTVYYIREDSLYKQVEGEDRVKIASDVYDVIKIYETGEIYYLTSEDSEISLMDYVTDDMKETDASITAPEYPDYPDAPDYPSWRDYDTDEEYDAALEQYQSDYEAWEAACDRMETEYYAAFEAYQAKKYRDELRADLEEEVLDLSSYSLCFYNGSEAAVITDAFVKDYYSYYTYASNAPVIIYEAYNQSSLEKIMFSDLSEVESVYDVEEMIEESLLSSSEKYIAVKTTATVVEQIKEARDFNVNSSGTAVYYIDDIPDEKSYGELYRISITDGVVGKAEVYDSDVYTGYCSFVGDDKFEYYKDCKDGKGELYINKEKIDYDVYFYNIPVHGDSDTIIYFTDWNNEKRYGTLKIYQNGKSVKIADDVHSFSAMSDGRILYLYDYSLNYYKGELHEWDDGETKKIDDDVVAFIPVYDTKYRGFMDW